MILIEPKPDGYRRKLLSSLLTFLLMMFSAPGYSGIIQLADPTSLSGTAVMDFEDLGLGNFDQVTFDSTFESGFTQFGEKFAGQTVESAGNFDVLSGTPSGPLSLANGPENENVTAIDGGAGDVGNTSIAGSGPLGYPDPNAVGEGAIAMLFDFDQSEFGFDVVGANGGTATAQFWTRDGSLLDQLVLDLDTSIFSSFGFKTDDDSFSIAGVSIFNNDLGGIGFDNFVSDVVGVPGPPPGSDPGTPPVSVPEPSGLLLILSSLSIFALRRRRKSM